MAQSPKDVIRYMKYKLTESVGIAVYGGSFWATVVLQSSSRSGGTENRRSTSLSLGEGAGLGDPKLVGCLVT